MPPNTAATVVIKKKNTRRTDTVKVTANLS